MSKTIQMAYSFANQIELRIQKDIKTLNTNSCEDDNFTRTLAKLNYLRVLKTTIELLELKTIEDNRRTLENG